VNDAAGGRGCLTKRVHMGHHIVTESLFVLGDFREVDIVKVRAHLEDCRLGDIDPKGALALCQGEPESTP
jgi:hypothetical protein